MTDEDLSKHCRDLIQQLIERKDIYRRGPQEPVRWDDLAQDVLQHHLPRNAPPNQHLPKWRLLSEYLQVHFDDLLEEEVT